MSTTQSKKILTDVQARAEASKLSAALLRKYDSPDATFIALVCAAQTLAVSTSMLREGFNEREFVADTLRLFAEQVADHLLILANSPESPTAVN